MGQWGGGRIGSGIDIEIDIDIDIETEIAIHIHFDMEVHGLTDCTVQWLYTARERKHQQQSGNENLKKK